MASKDLLNSHLTCFCCEILFSCLPVAEAHESMDACKLTHICHCIAEVWDGRDRVYILLETVLFKYNLLYCWCIVQITA